VSHVRLQLDFTVLLRELGFKAFIAGAVIENIGQQGAMFRGRLFAYELSCSFDSAVA
jgi:hypothetical protein